MTDPHARPRRRGGSSGDMGESLMSVPWASEHVGVNWERATHLTKSTAEGGGEVGGGGEDGRGEAGDVGHRARADAAVLERLGGT